jgi:hypothetical protein
MGEWIRDSTTLFIKNRGAGSPTTEEAVLKADTNE